VIKIFHKCLLETVGSCQIASKTWILGPTQVNSKQRTQMDLNLTRYYPIEVVLLQVDVTISACLVCTFSSHSMVEESSEAWDLISSCWFGIPHWEQSPPTCHQKKLD
jgi:hypothetical protein